MKYFVVLLGIAALLVFSACDSASPESTVSSAPASQESSLSSQADTIEESSEAHSLVSEDMPEESSDAEESSEENIMMGDPATFPPNTPEEYIYFEMDEEVPEELIKGAEEALQRWIDEIVLTPENNEYLEYFYKDLKVYCRTEDQTKIRFRVLTIYKLKNDDNFVWAGDVQAGTGDLEGYYIDGKDMGAEKRADGWIIPTGWPAEQQEAPAE